MGGEILEKLLPLSSVPEAKTTDSSITPVVVFSTLVALCGSFAFGCSSGYSSPAESGIREDLGLSVAAYSVFGSMLTVGALVGSLINGKIADLIGRRGAMWLSELFFIVGSLAIAFSKNVWLLDLGRLVTGIGVGIIIYVVPIYIAEITPKNIRGGFTTTNTFIMTCGFSLMFFLGNIVSWRTLALIESPRWLVKMGREEELETTLQHFRGKNADTSQELADVKDYTETFDRKSEVGIFYLFQRRYAYTLMIGVGLMALQQLVGTSAIGYYADSIFEEADFSSTVGSVSAAIAMILGSATSSLLIDKSGKRPLLLASTIGMFLSSIITALAFRLQDLHPFKKVTPILVYIGITGFNMACTLGVAGIPSLVMSEIFPINIKGPAGSLATFICWASAILSTYTFNFMMQWSTIGTFFILASICASNVLFVAFLVPETKDRTLEEIQASLTYFPE